MTELCNKCGKEITGGRLFRFSADGLEDAYSVKAWRLEDELKFCEDCQSNLQRVVWMWHRSYPPFDYSTQPWTEWEYTVKTSALRKVG